MKQGSVELAFVRGYELSNQQGILESKSRKQVYSITFKTLSEVPQRTMHEILHETIMLDEIKSYKSKNKK